jgi:hypothetical protein
MMGTDSTKSEVLAFTDDVRAPHVLSKPSIVGMVMGNYYSKRLGIQLKRILGFEGLLSQCGLLKMDVYQVTVVIHKYGCRSVLGCCKSSLQLAKETECC